MGTGRTTPPPTRDAVLIGSRALAVVYALLVPLHVLTLHGGTRVTMTLVALVSALLCAGVATLGEQVRDRHGEALLYVVCLTPLLNSLLHLALSRQIEQTTVVILAIVGIGAVAATRRQAVLLALGTCVGWVGVVLLVHPSPADQVGHYAMQLALACTLAAGVFTIKDRALRNLTRARLHSEVSLQRFHDVFEESPVGIALSDENGRFVEANKAVCRLFGRPVEEVIGHSSAEFTHPDDLHVHVPATQAVAARPGDAHVEKRYLRPDGTVRWALVSFARVAGPDGTPYTLAHVQDITERKEAEQELRSSRESMRAAVLVARAAQTGEDPRPVAIQHVRRLADAAFVNLIELRDQRLVATACDGRDDVVGISVGFDEPSVVGEVWRTGVPVFASQAVDHPLVQRSILEHLDATSVLWQPIGLPGQMQAVFAIGWDHRVPEVTAVQRAAVEVVAAETATALLGEQMRQELEAASVSDPLTGLTNRRGWEIEAARMERLARRGAGPLTVVVVDLDHFKAYNDRHGHLAGDEMLQEFAERLRTAVRDVDVVARWGGEEFTVALRDTGLAAAASVLERIREAAPLGLTCSVGAAEVAPGESMRTCLDRADAALYRAKSRGRDRVEVAGFPVAV